MLIAALPLPGLVHFLLGLLVLAVVVYAAQLFVRMLGLPEPVNRLAVLVVAVVGLVLLFQWTLL